MFEFVILNGFVVYYLLSLLLLENVGMGPRLFLPKRKVVYFNKSETNIYEWYATWIDCLRFVTGMYETRLIYVESSGKEEKVWYIKDSQMTELFECPYCLGFWLSTVSVVLITIFTRSDILNIFYKSDILITYYKSDILITLFLLSFMVLSSSGAGVFFYSIASDKSPPTEVH